MYARRVAPGASLTKPGARAAPPGPPHDPGGRAPTRTCPGGGAHPCSSAGPERRPRRPPARAGENWEWRLGAGARGRGAGGLAPGVRSPGPRPPAQSAPALPSLRRRAWRFLQTASDPGGGSPPALPSAVSPRPALKASSAFHSPLKSSSLLGPVPSGRSPVDVYPPSDPFPPATYSRAGIGRWGESGSGAATFPLTDGGTFRDLRGTDFGYAPLMGKFLSAPRPGKANKSKLCPREAKPSRFSRKVTRPLRARTSGNGGRGGGGRPSYLEQTYSAGMGKGRGLGRLPRIRKGHRGEGFLPAWWRPLAPVPMKDSGKSGQLACCRRVTWSLALARSQVGVGPYFSGRS